MRSWRAVRSESAAAVMRCWGVGVKALWDWRRALGVGRMDSEGNRRLIQAASAAGVEPSRHKTATNGKVQGCLRKAKANVSITYDTSASRQAERGGFEPPVRFKPHTAFPVPHNRPLCHLSEDRKCFYFSGFRDPISAVRFVMEGLHAIYGILPARMGCCKRRIRGVMHSKPSAWAAFPVPRQHSRLPPPRAQPGFVS
jgi:hypothetical protein